MKLSVIIPTFNRRDLLRRTLPSVLEQHFPVSECEVIVVVDGATDGTAAMLRECFGDRAGLRVLEQPNRGAAAARNAAVAQARGELLLFLDDDILCEPGLLEEHWQAFQRDTATVNFGPVEVADESPATIATAWTRRCTADYVGRLTREGKPSMPADAMIDANTSLARELFWRAGGFDESFGSARETAEFGLRLWQMGVEFRYVPTARVRQIYVKTTEIVARRDARAYGAGELRLCERFGRYRRHSPLARLREGRFWQRWAKLALARVPLDGLLRVMAWTAERFSAGDVGRRLGIRILEVRQFSNSYHAAIEALGSWEAFQARFDRRLSILLYHHVGPAVPGTYPELTIAPEAFARHVHWLLGQGYCPITLRQWAEWQGGEADLPPNAVLLTFDDGYADLARYAFPVLERYRVPAVVYLVTQRLGETNTWDEAAGSGTHRLLSENEVREWAARGISFGAHSRTHAALPRLRGPALDNEIGGSASDLAALLGRAAESLAYPWGAYDDEVLACAREHFEFGVTCEQGMNTLAVAPLRLRRTMVEPGDSLLDFALRAGIGFSPLQRVRDILGRLARKALGHASEPNHAA